MKKKTFFGIVAVFLIMIGGWFCWELNSSVDDACDAYFDYECEAYAYLLCAGQGGEFAAEFSEGGVCSGYDCHGVYFILCLSVEKGWFYDDIECIESGCSDCYPNN